MVAEDQFRHRARGSGNSCVTKQKSLINTAAMLRRAVFSLILLASFSLVQAGTETPPVSDRVIVSVKDQKLILVQGGVQIAAYPVSTSKFGIGDAWGRMTTPLGYLQVAQKIGDRAPVGGVFHNRRFTGEVLAPNAPGRDPITTRIIWLRGLEAGNAHAFERCIYIHGTPQESFIGKPASYGCIRMKSADVADLYNQLNLGALVQIVPDKLPKIPKSKNFRGIPEEKQGPSGILARSGKSIKNERGLHFGDKA
jgi:lipoprotein-anchoring transpeptidase ErfK/SrfK